MCRILLVGSKSWHLALIFALVILASVNALGQSPAGRALPAAQPSPTTPTKTPPSLESRFLKNILRDQRGIWTSPFKISRNDGKWIAPLGISSALLFATDHRSASEMAEGNDSQTRLRISRDISRAGDFYTTGGIAAFYLIGRTAENTRARETGLLGAEALIDGGIVSTTLKAITQRPRPRVDDASGEFFDRGNSFPSGHATSAWSLATVVAYEYGQHRPLVRFGAYGLATAVSLSRYTGRNHFISDVFVGSAIGYGIGRYVYRTHHDTSLVSEDSEMKTKEMRSKLIPFTSPTFSRASHTYGLALAWNF